MNYYAFVAVIATANSNATITTITLNECNFVKFKAYNTTNGFQY